jgi:hypothetical protein
MDIVDPGSNNARGSMTGVTGWSGARRNALALLMIAGLAGAAGGCASTARCPVAERRVAAPARIQNLSLSAVHVYVEQGGRTHLIGSVPPLSVVRLRVPPELARSGKRLGLLVAPTSRRYGVGQRVLVADVLVDELTTRGWTVVDSSY